MAFVSYMVLIRPFLAHRYKPFHLEPTATVYVKALDFFIEQGGDKAEWGLGWEELKVEAGESVQAEIAAVRKLAMAIGIDRAKALRY